MADQDDKSFLKNERYVLVKKCYVLIQTSPLFMFYVRGSLTFSFSSEAVLFVFAVSENLLSFVFQNVYFCVHKIEIICLHTLCISTEEFQRAADEFEALCKALDEDQSGELSKEHGPQCTHPQRAPKITRSGQGQDQ